MPVQHFLESSGFTVKYVDARITDYARKMEKTVMVENSQRVSNG